MKCSEPCDKVSSALVAVAREVRVVGKSGDNKYDRYQYAKLEDYIKGTCESLSKHGLTIITSAENAETLPVRKTDKDKEQYPVRVFLTMRAVHESGQWVEVCSVGEGQDRGDKGAYKAITGARKYGIACLLGLGTSDDPENDNVPEPPPPRRETPKAEPVAAAESPAAAFARTVCEWAGAAPEDRKAACADAAKRCGGVWKKDVPEDECRRMLAVVTEARGRGLDYAEFLAEKN